MERATIHMVPVPEDRLQEVYAVLGRPRGEEGAAGSAPSAPPSPGGDGDSSLDSALIARAYRESSPAMAKFLDYLADHPDETISSVTLAEHMELTWNQLAGVLGAFGRRWKNRYQQQGKWFFGAYWNYAQGNQDYTMPSAVADVIKRARSGS